MRYHKFTVIFLYFVQINGKSLNISDDNRVEKREILDNIEDLFPDWVPFKNKHGDKLGEFVPVKPKRRIIKRLAMPLSYALKSFADADDYFEKGGSDNDADYFEMEDVSDTSRSGSANMHSVDTENSADTETGASNTKDQASKTDEATKDKSKPGTEKPVKKSKTKTIDIDYTDDDDEGSTTSKGKGDDLSLKIKTKNNIEADKTVLDIEQKLILNALNKEEAMQTEERQRDIDIMDRGNIDKYTGEKTQKKDYDDYDEIVKDIGVDKYKYHPIRKPSKDDTPVRTSTIPPEVTRTDSTPSTADIVPTGKISVFRNPGVYMVFDEDPKIASNSVTTIASRLLTKPRLPSASLNTKVPPKKKVAKPKKQSVKIAPRRKKTTSTTTISTTPTTVESYTPSSVHNPKLKKSSTERIHISFVPQDTETREDEPTLFFPKKRKPKTNPKPINLPPLKTASFLSSDTTGSDTKIETQKTVPNFDRNAGKSIKYFEKLKPSFRRNKNSSSQGLKTADQKDSIESVEIVSKETDSGESRFNSRPMSSSENNGVSKKSMQRFNGTRYIKDSLEGTSTFAESDPMESSHGHVIAVVDPIETTHQHSTKNVSPGSSDQSTRWHNIKDFSRESSDPMMESTRRHNIKDVSREASDSVMEPTRQHNIKDVSREASDPMMESTRLYNTKDVSREASDSVVESTHQHIIKDVTPEESDPAMDSTNPHMNTEGKPHEAERGGVKEHHAEHQASHGENAKKEYSAEHKDVKTDKGYHDKDDHVGSYHDHGGHDEKHHDEKKHHGSHLHQEHGKKHAEYEESGRHSKGHSTKGSHDIHKKEEYEKNVEFFEEEGDSTEEQKKVGHKNIQRNRKGEKYDNNKFNSGNIDYAKGELRGFRKTGYGNSERGHDRLEDDDRYAKQLYAKHGKKTHDDSRKWIFHHSHPPKTANFVVIDRRNDPLHHDQLHHGPQYYG